MGLSVFTSPSHQEHEQKTVGKNASKTDTGSILVLDDDFDINNMLQMSLQKQGIQCLWLYRSTVSIGAF